MTFDAIILAGARSRRLNGADKAAVVLGGRTLLERAAGALVAAARTVVVGPRREISLGVEWIEEEQPGRGPVPALAAGIEWVRSEAVVVLAVDYPLITATELEILVTSMRADGAVAVDDEGREQPLLGAYRTKSLRDVLVGLSSLHGSRVSDLVASLDLEPVQIGWRARDCDTWEEIAKLETTVR